MRGMRLFVAVSLVVGSASCDALRGPDDAGGALVSLAGQVTYAGAEPLDGLRVAFLWERPAVTEAGTAVIRTSAQEVDLVPEFPARFVLPLYDLPPADVLLPGVDARGVGFFDGMAAPPDDAALAGARFARGIVVAYIDRNGNGRLDLLERTATAAVDHIVGYSDGYRVLYVESAAAVPPLVLGFNLIAEGTGTTLPADTELAMTLDTRLALETLACADGMAFAGDSESLGVVPLEDFLARAATVVDAGDLDLECYGREVAFTVTEVVAHPELCVYETRQAHGFCELGEGAPFPADWPCGPCPSEDADPDATCPTEAYADR